MLYPSINLLREKVDSKYTLVSMASKRARDIIDGKPVLTDSDIDKPISIATKEIAEDQITYRRNFSTEQEALEMEHRLKEDALDIAEKSEESDDGIIEYTAAEE
jgi:DNA-directed RNA polymerase subunit omega